jgi:ubiquinone/menaquinone biosynthesis C-methylase UbiE
LFDGYSIPYPDKFFDVAICIHVLEHVEHERILLREIARVANEIVVEVPLEGGLIIEKSIRQGANFGHINHYTVPGFLFLLQTTGLEPIEHIVSTSSAAYERHLYGGFRGTIKNAIRKGALKIAPSIAPWLMTYLLTVRCVVQS